MAARICSGEGEEAEDIGEISYITVNDVSTQEAYLQLRIWLRLRAGPDVVTQLQCRF